MPALDTEAHDRVAGVVRKHAEDCLGVREEMLERLLTYRVGGLREIRLVEEWDAEHLRHTFRFELEHEDGPI